MTKKSQFRSDSHSNRITKTAFETLQAACINKPFISFKTLAIRDYIVENFQRVKTQYGNRVRVELVDCIVYLPERFAAGLTDKKFEELNEGVVVMSYGGKDPDTQNRLLCIVIRYHQCERCR